MPNVKPPAPVREHGAGVENLTGPPIIAPTALDAEAVADHAARVREAIPGTVVVVTTTSRSGRTRVRRQVLLTLDGVEAAVERALVRGHEVAVVAVRLVPLLALLCLAATADHSVRRGWLAVIRSPRSAFVSPFLTRRAAFRRVQLARLDGWSARAVEVDLVAVDGRSLDPLDLPEPDPLAEARPAPARRRRNRRTRARLAADEAASALDGDVVELDDRVVDEVVGFDAGAAR